MCLYPQLIKNRKYIANKKNGGNIPAVPDKRMLMVPVGCQKCIECKKQKANEHRMRLLEDLRHNKYEVTRTKKNNGKYESYKIEKTKQTPHFITLTFNTESINKLTNNIRLTGYELDNEMAIKAMRLFNERWRKAYKEAIRHWMVTELGHGETEHLHLHGIMWTDRPKEIEKKWQYGYVHIGEFVNEKTVNYITKYINKIDFEHKEYNPRVLTSPGIGGSYMKRTDAINNKYTPNGETNEAYTTRTGHKIMLPIYLRNKIYTEEERQKLWLEKLDKQERWVLGKKIDISKGEEMYYKHLEAARKKNKQLGYGDNSKNWDRKKYEAERRNLQYKKRKGLE